tara:strand:- start:58 stop:831 length:774 start_codon:yes stop_codon:yes gene_type:complete
MEQKSGISTGNRIDRGKNMKLLFESWRRYLKEGRELEQYTTLISREIVNALKDSDVKDAFNQAKQAYFKLDIEHILDNLEYVKDVYVNMLEGDLVYAHAKYEFDLDATEEQRKNSEIVVDVILPIGYENSIFSELIPEIKESLRHELEHSTQPTEMLMKIQKKIPTGDVWNTLESAEAYFTNESETKAHVVGIYKKAKMFKEPAGEVLDQELMNIYSTGLHYGYTEEELGPIMSKIREYWRYYMQSRFPHAEIDWDR